MGRWKEFSCGQVAKHKFIFMTFSFPFSLVQEPSTKRVRPLGRVTSLANLISPVKNGAVRRFGQTLQASFRGDGRSPSVPHHKACSKAAAPTPPKRRNSTLWSETLDVHQKGTFSTKEIKRQEVSRRTNQTTKSTSTFQPDPPESALVTY